MNKLVSIIFVLILSLTYISCGEKKQETQTPDEEAAYSANKDLEIQKYNLEVKKEQSGSIGPCDSLAVVEYVIDNYPEGSYLVNFDKTFTYNVPKPALLYLKGADTTYIFGVVARSKPGERYIEPKNIVGYDQSFIDLDSTELGTAFFYLTLFRCNYNGISVVWEAPIPSHGGFNNIRMDKWTYNGTPYIRVYFYYARGIGHIVYNYFLIDGLTKLPHLLMTYKGINFQRSMANINNDKYPDYYEYVFYDLGDRVYAADSVGFIWKVKDSVYVNTRNSRQTRPY